MSAPLQAHYGIYRTPYTGEIRNNFASQFIEFCHTNKIQFVLVGPGTLPTLRAALRKLDWLGHKNGDFLIIDVPRK